jgi:hypothetical protein
VNSPGPDCGVGAPATDCDAGAPGLDSETWEGCAENGVLPAGAPGCVPPLPPIELNICVNAPGPELAGVPDPDCGAGAPGLDSETWETVETPTVGSFGGFSMATGLKTRATSSVRPVPDGVLDPALPLAPGTVSACSMRVNSPGPDCVGAPGLDSETWEGGVGAGAIGALEIGAAAGCGAAAGGAASGAFGVACPRSDASKSSSARGAAGTCPKTPVALEGWLVLFESVGSNGFLGASMRGHLAW